MTIKKEDTRKIWETKTFWGGILFAVAIIAEVYFGVDLAVLKVLALTWTGVSVAERLRT